MRTTQGESNTNRTKKLLHLQTATNIPVQRRPHTQGIQFSALPLQIHIKDAHQWITRVFSVRHVTSPTAFV